MRKVVALKKLPTTRGRAMPGCAGNKIADTTKGCVAGGTAWATLRV